MSRQPESAAKMFGAAASGQSMVARARHWWRRCSLLQRVLFSIVLAAPLVWLLEVGLNFQHARREVNELFDTQMIRLARQLQATLPHASLDHSAAPAVALPADMGNADLEDMALAVWDQNARLLLVDREGTQMPHRLDVTGFIDLTLGDDRWRAYYLPALDGRWLIAVGQAQEERDEIIKTLVLGQLVPWLLMLPLLLVVMAWSVRQALWPLGELGSALALRHVDDLEPLRIDSMPRDLQPLAISMNSLFLRIDVALERERRFTGDAAHELRTPLAALRAQWDALRLSMPADGAATNAAAVTKINAGLDRLQRLLAQLLELARVDHDSQLAEPQPIDWPALLPPLLGELLPLATQRQVELAVEWPVDVQPLPMAGDAGLLAVLLRNLLDNALQVSPAGSTVRVRFSADALEVLDRGPGVEAGDLVRLGDRFFRPVGSTNGSGLGLSIAMRIAALHGLALQLEPRRPGPGMVARLMPAREPNLT